MSLERWLAAASIVATTLVAIEAGSASAPSPKPFVVQYRLSQWRSAHINDKLSADKFSDGLKKLGCEVKVSSHGNHMDVSYRCPEWKSLSAVSDDSAHRWEDWLRKHGFQTSHEH